MIQKQFDNEWARIERDEPDFDPKELLKDYITFDGKKPKVNWWNILLKIGPFVAKVIWALLKNDIEKKAKADANGDIWYS